MQCIDSPSVHSATSKIDVTGTPVPPVPLSRVILLHLNRPGVVGLRWVGVEVGVWLVFRVDETVCVYVSTIVRWSQTGAKLRRTHGHRKHAQLITAQGVQIVGQVLG